MGELARLACRCDDPFELTEPPPLAEPIMGRRERRFGETRIGAWVGRAGSLGPVDETSITHHDRRCLGTPGPVSHGSARWGGAREDYVLSTGGAL